MCLSVVALGLRDQSIEYVDITLGIDVEIRNIYIYIYIYIYMIIYAVCTHACII